MKAIAPLLEIILMLVLTLIVLTSYALIDFQISFGVELKKSPLKTYLIEPKPQPFLTKKLSEFLVQISDTVINTKFNQTAQKVDSSSQTILLTGDSMCEGLMFRFKDYAKQNNHKLETVIWYSSTTVKWSESDSLRKLIAKYKPSYIFFTTGSNELFIRNIEDREKYIQNIVNQAGDKPFVWIGPPNWAEDTGINDLIVKNTGKDRYFESKKLTFQRGGDGAHPTWSSAAVWADSISTWVMSKSRHKILMQKPKK